MTKLTEKEVRKIRDAIKDDEEREAKFKNLNEQEFQWLVAFTMVSRGMKYQELEEYQTAIDLYKEVEVIYGKSEDAMILGEVARGLSLIGYVHLEQKQTENAIEAFIELERKMGHIAEPEVQRWIVNSLISLGEAYGILDNVKKERKTYLLIMSRYKNTIIPLIMSEVIRAMIRLSATYANEEDFDMAIGLMEGAIKKYQDNNTVEVGTMVAFAMLNLSRFYITDDKEIQALKTLRSMVDRYGNTVHPEIQESVDQAREILAGTT